MLYFQDSCADMGLKCQKGEHQIMRTFSHFQSETFILLFHFYHIYLPLSY